MRVGFAGLGHMEVDAARGDRAMADARNLRQLFETHEVTILTSSRL